MTETSKRTTREWCHSCIFIVLFATKTAFPAAAEMAESVTSASASPIAVDVRTEVCRAVGQADIGYSPKWSGVTNAGAYVVLQKVVDGVTNTVATLDADAEDEYLYTFEGGVSPFVRFIHRVYSSGGVEIGEPLVREISFGCRSAEGASFSADSRTNSLQEVASARAPVNLAYSTAWAANSASVSIKAVKLSDRGGAPVATNAMFSAAADAEGVTQMRGVGRGWWRLLCEISDGSGDVLLEYLTDEFKMQGGFMMSVW